MRLQRLWHRSRLKPNSVGQPEKEKLLPFVGQWSTLLNIWGSSTSRSNIFQVSGIGWRTFYLGHPIEIQIPRDPRDEVRAYIPPPPSMEDFAITVEEIPVGVRESLLFHFHSGKAGGHQGVTRTLCG
eukprot:GHVS01023937.1.p1 GENE.GHVS01023937.1~~GHVS01023937.1.p1  ORF type:complete len:127 (+),score=10.01 GHVS01023937.1:304-684(+)